MKMVPELEYVDVFKANGMAVGSLDWTVKLKGNLSTCHSNMLSAVEAALKELPQIKKELNDYAKWLMEQEEKEAKQEEQKDLPQAM